METWWSEPEELKMALSVRSFWCPFERRSVVAEFLEREADGRREAVNWCSAFAPPTSITCGMPCLHLDELPVAVEVAA